MDLRLLGPVELIGDDGPVAIPGEKQRMLLALLALRANEVVTSDWLTDQIWSGQDSASPNTLQAHVGRLRRALAGVGAVEISTRPHGYQLQTDPDLIDVVRFERLVALGGQCALAGDAAEAARTLREALSLWRGRPMGDLPGPAAALEAAERLGLRRGHALESLFEAELAAGHHSHVVAELEAAVREYPLRETLWAYLILARYRCGRRSEALDAYQALRRTLVDELGVEPSAELVTLQRGVIDADPSLAAPPQQIATRHRTGIPLAPNPLVGRAGEVEAIAAKLELPDVRLLTLTGPGGVGKTRLAIAVASRAADEVFADGIFFVSLATFTTAEEMCWAIAEAVGAGDLDPASAMSDLADHLARRRVLLVLDNLEQLVEAADVLNHVLVAGSGPTVLATSQSRLRLSHEHVFGVSPLQTSGRAGEGAVAANPAVALFEQCAARLVDVRGWSSEAIDAVSAICSRLDGLPLAIELAAGQTRMLSPQQVLEQLENHVPILVSADRDLPDRHRTLNATIHWGYDLLPPGEKRLFAELSVFSGSFELAAVAEVADLSIADALQMLGTLVDHSLVRSEPGRRMTRYSLLSTIHEYASELLEDLGATRATTARHCAYYTKILAPILRLPTIGGEYHRIFERAKEEAENFREALRAAWENDDVTSVATLAVGLEAYWYDNGLNFEGEQWYQRLLPRRHELPDFLRCTLLVRAANMLDLSTASSFAWLTEAAEGFSRLGEANWVARCQWDLGWIHMLRGDFDGAHRLLTLAMSTATRLGDEVLANRVASGLAGVAECRGEYELAAEIYLDLVATHKARQEPRDATINLANLGVVRAAQDALDLCAEAADEAVRMAREMDNPPLGLFSTALLAVAAAKQQDWAAVGWHVLDAIAFARSGASIMWGGEYMAYVSLTVALLSVEEHASAAVLLSVIDHKDEELSPLLRGLLPVSVEGIREAMLPADFDRAWQRGSTMSSAEARTFAQDAATSLRAEGVGFEPTMGVTP